MTENDYWMNSPFGNESIFSPDFDIKQKEESKKREQSIYEANSAPKVHYFSYSGKYLGSENKNIDRIYVANKKNSDGTFQYAKDLKVTLEEFKGFASLVWNESSGDKTESFAIANTVMNYLSNGGSNQLNSLKNIILKANSYARGVEQSLVEKYSNAEKNSRHEIEAIINALMRAKHPEFITETAFLDYSRSSTHWDGVDLVVAFVISNKQIKSVSNSHRNYIWSEKSKTLLNTYYDQYGKDTISYKGVTKTNKKVNPKVWRYSETEFEVEAKRVKGKTLFQKLHTGFGEGFKENQKNIDYSILNIFHVS
jgi:hypothetical protein